MASTGFILPTAAQLYLEAPWSEEAWMILLWIIYIALVVLTEKLIQLLTPIIVPLLPETLV